TRPPHSLVKHLPFRQATPMPFATVPNHSRHFLPRRTAAPNTRRRFIGSATRLATRLHALQSRDARLGFESSNQYFYTPHDLVEKVINCRWLAARLDAAKPGLNEPK